MKQYLVSFCLGVFSSFSMASMYIYQPIGSSIVLGGYGNRHALSTSSGNPASSYLMANLEGFRFGFIGPVGIGAEGGGVTNINDKIDDLTDALDLTFLDDFYDSIEDANNGTFTDAQAVTTAQDLLDGADETLADVSAVAADIADSTYAKVSTTLQAPFLPIIYKTRRRSVFTFDASASLVGRAGILADDITYTGLEDIENVTSVSDLANADIDDADLETDAALYLKRASDYRFSLGYSTMYARSPNSAFILGGRLNFHRLALGQKVSVLTEDDDMSVSYSDFFISRDNISSGVSLDLGAMLVSRNFQLGVSIANVNEPEFEYEAIGDCTGLSGADLTNCNAAVSYAADGEISLEETYTMEAQATIDVAIKSKDQYISLAASYDFNPIKDPLGDEYQWSVLSLSYFTDYVLLPGIRVGVRENMVGNELRYITAGVTFYRRLDIDVGYADENDSGDTGFYFSAGYSFVF